MTTRPTVHGWPLTTNFKTSGLHAGTALVNDAYDHLSQATKRQLPVGGLTIEKRVPRVWVCIGV